MAFETFKNTMQSIANKIKQLAGVSNDNKYNLQGLDGLLQSLQESQTVKTANTKLTSNSTSISFTGLTAQPKMFAICPTGNITLGSTRYVTSVMYDGSTTHGTYGYRSGSTAYSYYSASYFTWTYSNGTLTVRTNSATNGGNFNNSVTYKLAYIT